MNILAPSYQSSERIFVVQWFRENYEKVRQKLKQSEDTSDLMTSDDEKRKRWPSKKVYKSEDGDSEGEGVEMSTPKRQQIVSDTSQNTVQTPVSHLSPPPRLSSQELRSPTDIQRSILPVPTTSREPSRGQAIGPTAQIMTILEILRKETREVKRMVQHLLTRSAVEDQPPQLPQDFILPADSCENVESNENLLADQENFQSMVQFLSSYGGGNVRETVDRIMKEVMTNDAAKLYNMKGMKGKLKFEELRLLKVLYRCVQKNQPTVNATRKDVEAEVSKWLTGERNRDGGRKARNKRAQVPPASPPANDEN
ncbi:hypothetical protein ACF0H5_001319 [Mactra antiquata]